MIMTAKHVPRGVAKECQEGARAPGTTLGGAEMTFKKCYCCYVVVVDFWQEGELNCVLYAYQNFLGQRGPAPCIPCQKT